MSGQGTSSFSKELLRYIRTGDNSRAMGMLTPALARESNDFGTLLHRAARFGNESIARELVRLGADVNSIGLNNQTPLMVAIERRHPATIKYLLEAGTNMEIINANGQTAMQMVWDLGPGCMHILRLFQNKMRLDSSSVEELFARVRNTGSTMHEAVRFGDLNLLQMMLDAGMDINAPGFFKLTALHAAVDQNNSQLAEWLIARNANVNAVDEDGFTPLLMCIVGRVNKDMLKLLLEHGADPNLGTFRTKESPLYALVNYEHSNKDVFECMKLLFQYGAIPHNLHGAVDTIFDDALNSGSPKRAKYLVEHVVLLEKMGTLINVNVMRCNSKSNQKKFGELLDNRRRILDDLVFKQLSLFDLITASDCRLRNCARHRMFVPTIREFRQTKKLRILYPYLCDTLAKRIDEAVNGVRLEDVAIPIMCEYFGSRGDALYFIARLVAGYLDREDLDRLSKV